MIKTKYICAVAEELNDINTGAWKTYPLQLDQTKCIKCGLCVQYCPTNSVICDEKGGFFINLDYCKGCGVCINECPKKAISYVKEDQ